jgi:deoxyadenosine/deoxycytidine kinase
MHESSVWTPPELRPTREKARYICVTGNSGTGKSTLVSRFTRDLFPELPVIGIDERTTHHPYLDLLFHRPDAYALEMQLNFMLQRVLIARRWLESGVNVIMERSHLDDPVFIEFLHRKGLVDDHQKSVYRQLWDILNERTPLPDALVILQARPEDSVNRVTSAEEEGLRPREFASLQHKVEWITGWAELYAERATYLTTDNRYGQISQIFSEDSSYEEIRDFVVSKITEPGS